MKQDVPVVYLDTQDFSRFGRVIEGKDTSGAGPVFEQLVVHAEKGTARFVYSMSTLSELLQYHPDHEETSVAKARAVELLCRGNAMAGVPRVIAFEIAKFAHERGWLQNEPRWEAAGSGNCWFPNLGNVFADFRTKFEESRTKSLQELGTLNRRGRRVAERGISDRSFKKFAESAARAVADDYGLPGAGFAAAFNMYARGKITGEEASRRLFSAIAKPTSFNQFYFHKYEGEKDLPAWMRGVGEGIQSGIEKMTRDLSRFSLDDLNQFHGHALDMWKNRLASTIVGFALEEGEEFGLSDDVVRAAQSHSEILRIPSCANLVELIGEYVAQCIGLRGPKARVEASFGSDLIHAIYIPHVNIWRGDRRFSNLVRERRIQGSTMICASGDGAAATASR